MPQQLPFFQEIEFYPPPFAHGINEIEVTFVAAPQAMDVILEADKRGGMFTGGRDAYGHLHVVYSTAAHTDWAAQIDGWLRGVLGHRPTGVAAPGRGAPGHNSYGGHHGHHGRGMGVGGVVGGVAAGPGGRICGW